MQLSRQADYAVRVVIDIASQPPGEKAIMRAIGERQEVPVPFLAKIVRRLSDARLLSTYRGSGGGIALARPAAEISLLQIIEAIEGPICLNRCTTQPSQCSRDAFCPVHPVWAQAQAYLVTLLGSTRVSDLVAKPAFFAPGAE